MAIEQLVFLARPWPVYTYKNIYKGRHSPLLFYLRKNHHERWECLVCVASISFHFGNRKKIKYPRNKITPDQFLWKNQIISKRTCDSSLFG
jgi:hypothetical protein